MKKSRVEEMAELLGYQAFKESEYRGARCAVACIDMALAFKNALRQKSVVANVNGKLCEVIKFNDILEFFAFEAGEGKK